MKDMLYLMTAKICHDLATPLSAMGMGLEAVEETEITKIIKQSLEASIFKLKFYRDFLNHSMEGPLVSDFVPLLNEYAKQHQVQITWPSFLTCEGDKARILMGLVYMMIESLARGGTVLVREKEEDYTLVSEGEVCRLRDDYKDVLQKNLGNHFNARSVMPYFLKSLAKEIRHDISLASEHPLTLHFFKK